MHLPKDNILNSSKFGASSLRCGSLKYDTKVSRLEIWNNTFKTVYLVCKTSCCKFGVGRGSLNTGVKNC